MRFAVAPKTGDNCSMRGPSGASWLAPKTTVLVALLLAGSALAAPPPSPTRGQYRASVEPICKTATDANADILKGVEGMVRHGKLKLAAARFSRAADALEKTVKRVAAVPRPKADFSRLAKWLQYATAGEVLMQRMSQKLDEGKKAKVQRMANQLLKKAKQANALVVGFDFDYCRLNPARFA